MSARYRVIDLYKKVRLHSKSPKNVSTTSAIFLIIGKLLHLGKDYPSGHDFFKTKLHNAFMKNSKETDPVKIEKMIDHGEFVVKELEALYMLKKYRTLKRRYYDNT